MPSTYSGPNYTPKSIVHIVGPWAPTPSTTIRQNVARANALAALAMRMGLVPVVPHLTISGPALALESYVPDPDQIARDACYGPAELGGLTRYLATAGCVVWGILRDDGTPSPGTSIELGIHNAFNAGYGQTLKTWLVWRDTFQLQGLLSLWEQANGANPPVKLWP